MGGSLYAPHDLLYFLVQINLIVVTPCIADFKPKVDEMKPKATGGSGKFLIDDVTAKLFITLQSRMLYIILCIIPITEFSCQATVYYFIQYLLLLMPALYHLLYVDSSSAGDSIVTVVAATDEGGQNRMHHQAFLPISTATGLSFSNSSSYGKIGLLLLSAVCLLLEAAAFSSSLISI